MTNSNDVPQTPGHQPQPTVSFYTQNVKNFSFFQTPEATTSKMNKYDAMKQFDNILKSLDELEKPDFLNYVQIKLKLEEEEKQRKELEKRKEHIKHESKEVRDLKLFSIIYKISQIPVPREAREEVAKMCDTLPRIRLPMQKNEKLLSYYGMDVS